MIMKEIVKIYNESMNELPDYANDGDAGMDVRANLHGVQNKFLFNAEFDGKRIIIHPLGRALIPTGIYTSFDKNLECQVRSRSGLALKSGVHVLNSPGTIDSGYRNEYGVILFNTSDSDFIVEQGDRIAQLVFNRIERISFEVVDNKEDLDSSDRGGGFGSTGVK